MKKIKSGRDDHLVGYMRNALKKIEYRCSGVGTQIKLSQA